MKKLRFIGRKAHGVIAYIVGILLIVSPWLFGFHEGGPETWGAIIPGALIIIYNLITNHELGAIHALPMGVALLCDLLIGITVVMAPGLLAFGEEVRVPFVLFGLLMIFLALFTKGTSEETSRRSDLPKSVQ